MAYGLNLRIVVAKEESVPGTLETFADSDFDVRIRNPEVTPIVEINDEGSKYATGDHGEDEAVMGAQSGTISCSTKLCTAGDVTTEPNWWKLAKGCGCDVATYTTTGIGLQPLKSADTQTLSIGVFDIQLGGSAPTAVAYYFAGCVGNMTIGADNINSAWMGNFEFTGKLTDIVDVANANILELTGIDTTHPERFLNNTVSVGGVSQCISSFQLDLGNEINPLICQSQATGYQQHIITARAPRLSMNPLMQSVATEDVWDKMVGTTPTTEAITISSANMTLYVPKAQLLSAGVANREGLINWDQNYKCLRNGSTFATLPDEVTWELLIGARA